MRERALGPEHPEVAAALNNLAVLLRVVDKVRSLHVMGFRHLQRATWLSCHLG